MLYSKFLHYGFYCKKATNFKKVEASHTYATSQHKRFTPSAQSQDGPQRLASPMWNMATITLCLPNWPHGLNFSLIQHSDPDHHNVINVTSDLDIFDKFEEICSWNIVFAKTEQRARQTTWKQNFLSHTKHNPNNIWLAWTKVHSFFCCCM